MGCGAHPSRTNGVIVVNTKQRYVRGCGAVALRNGLKRVGVEISITAARELGTRGDLRIRNARRYYRCYSASVTIYRQPSVFLTFGSYDISTLLWRRFFKLGTY